MGSNHAHGGAALREGHQKKLLMALALTGIFMIAEVIGACVTGSLALLSDASHMLTDTAALAISLIALQIAKRPADQETDFWICSHRDPSLNVQCLITLYGRCLHFVRGVSALASTVGDCYRCDDVDRNWGSFCEPDIDASALLCQQ